MRTGIIISLLLFSSCQIMTYHEIIYPHIEGSSDCRRVFNIYQNNVLIETDTVNCYNEVHCNDCIYLHPVIIKPGDTVRYGPWDCYEIINR